MCIRCTRSFRRRARITTRPRRSGRLCARRRARRLSCASSSCAASSLRRRPALSSALSIQRRRCRAGAERAEGGVASRRPGPCFVTFWSAPVELSAASPPEIVRFHLDATAVAGDVRVSVFSLPALVRERARRLQRGLSGRLPFDRAPAPPWRDVEEGAGGGGGGGASHLESLDDERVRAGDEPGCLFYFIFHTAYAKLEMSRLSFGAGADGGGPSEMRVPVRMMDKAFKSVGMRKSKYRDDGEATLTLSRPADVGVAPPLAHEAAPPHPHAPAAACTSCGEGAAACSAAVPPAPLQQPAPRS